MTKPDIIGVTEMNRRAHKSLTKAGFTVKWFTQYHGRLEGEDVDVFCRSDLQSHYEDTKSGNFGSSWERDIGECIRHYISNGRKQQKGWFSNDDCLDYRSDDEKQNEALRAKLLIADAALQEIISHRRADSSMTSTEEALKMLETAKTALNRIHPLPL